MVRVPGSLGDSGFHRESPHEDTQKVGPVMDLEDKPRPPPQVPAGIPAVLDENLDPPDESPPAQDGTNTSIQPRTGRSTAKKKTSKSKPSRKKIKAPDSETEDRGDLMCDDQQTTTRRNCIQATDPVKVNCNKIDTDSTRSTPIVAPGDQTAASSPYVSATEEVESSDSEEPPRMTLGPAGAAMLQKRAKETAGRTAIHPRDTLEAMVNSKRHPPEKLESIFKQPWKAINTPLIRVSAMSELKEFAGKDGDEDRAWSWLGKVKSAFIRDQAPDQEKCLVFGDLLTGPARNWYRQLSRTTRSTWKDLHQSFQVQYCGRDVSVARQYYHARKRSDASPLEYLHRLNVAGLRTRLQIKDGSQEVRREHVEHFIETLDDRDLSDQLDLLRIPDADTLEEVLVSEQNQGRAKRSWGDATRVGREDDKLERLPGWNPVRAERSRFCIYAYVEKQSKAAVSKVIDNTCDLEKESATAIANLHQTNECSRSEVKMTWIFHQENHDDIGNIMCQTRSSRKEKLLRVQANSGDTKIAMWLTGDRVPRLPGYVSVGSRRYAEWQNLAYGTSDLDQRLNTSAHQWRNQRRVEGRATNPDGLGDFSGEHKHIPADDATSTHSAPVDLGDRVVDPGDEEVCIKESGDLYAEDVEGHLAVLPEVTLTTEEVKIEDIQVGNPHDNTREQVDQLKQIIWRRRHLLIGKGNALPPAAKGAICDIDVGNVKPVSQRVRKVAPQFRENLFQLIKGLLSAKIIRHSTSPWASPIVVIIKKNGIDIRLCIDYRLVKSLTRLMVYPIPLINDLLDDLDKVLFSAFMAPFGLFEWNRMPFGLKNAPQIYQRLLDNALYGFLKITKRQDHQARNAGDQGHHRPIDLFQDGEPNTDKESSVLSRRSYIDDILVTAGSWDMLCERVDKLLDTCDEWNLLISVAKSFWGLKKVYYLGHRISAGGMEARPKDLSSLVDLPFSTSLRSMRSFLGSLNYYSRFIESFAIYASILYELREIDFFEASGQAKARLEGDDQNQRDKWTQAAKAFVTLKDKIVNAPILTHFDSDKRPVVILYTSKWAISAALVQNHDGVYKPVTFT
ncbi:unnamed protein product [Phytophthora fragariaefolia]|uniref:Unnamed protein product n=1 Tax=Phytophthora fragariaefolia TaxID=1490495 RepID=A0A9W6XMD9_9STRA|nr:unnamed protein product [Phytophthora fragariaefolia]